MPFLRGNLELELLMLVACDFPQLLEAFKIYLFLTEALSTLKEPRLQSQLA